MSRILVAIAVVVALAYSVSAQTPTVLNAAVGSDWISTAQILLLLAPAELEMVRRPSATVTTAAPSMNGNVLV